jgi:hypothetical protein
MDEFLKARGHQPDHVSSHDNSTVVDDDDAADEENIIASAPSDAEVEDE